MLLTAASAASCSLRRPLLPAVTVRTEGGAPAPRTGAAKFWALTTPLQPSSSSAFSGACSPSPGDKDSAREVFDEYSVLSPDIPWEVEDIWRTFGAYFFTLHIPLSFGGLDVVAKLLHCPSLDPLTTVASTVMLQLGELSLALALLQYVAKPHHEVRTFFAGKFSLQRGWVKETVLGFGFLMTLVWLTSFVSDKLIGPEDAYDPILKGILSDSPVSSLFCFFLYSVIAPLLEETIYRGFLLTALSSSMKWTNAVILSSLMFSVAHLSGKSFCQLFVVGSITGLAYCRTGTLAASFTIHTFATLPTSILTLNILEHEPGIKSQLVNTQFR